MIRYGFVQFIIALITALSIQVSALCQVIPSLRYLSHTVLEPNELDGELIGGFSGITYNSKIQKFILVADKPPSRLLTAEINPQKQSSLSWNETIFLNPKPMAVSELEGIAFAKSNGHYYVSDEQNDGTRILEINEAATFKRVVFPNNKPFLPLSSYNSGIEGLTISDNNIYLYYAFERPTSDCQQNRLTTIGKIDLYNTKTETFPYQLHEVENDVLGTNGVSAMLVWNDTTLLVMERAYIPQTGNIVRLYEVSLKEQGLVKEMISCEINTVEPLSSRLVYDFSNEPSFEIDNAEGMSFNEDKSLLYIITDNNFSSKQETQLVILQIQP